MVIGTNSSSVLVYKLQANSTYDLVQTLIPLHGSSTPQLTDDGKYLIIMESSLTIGVHHKTNNGYDRVQTIMPGSMMLDAKISGSSKFLVLLDLFSNLKIYEKK